MLFKVKTKLSERKRAQDTGALLSEVQRGKQSKRSPGTARRGRWRPHPPFPLRETLRQTTKKEASHCHSFSTGIYVSIGSFLIRSFICSLTHSFSSSVSARQVSECYVPAPRAEGFSAFRSTPSLGYRFLT